MSREMREKQLIETFVEIADTMVGGYDVVDLLYRLVSRCSIIFAAADAGILLRIDGHPLEVVASTTERSQLISLLQLSADEGPCVDAYRSGEPVTVDDIASIRERWPDFAARAGALGYNWMHAVPLRLRDEVIGSLNLFGTDPRPSARKTFERRVVWPTSRRSESSTSRRSEKLISRALSCSRRWTVVW